MRKATVRVQFLYCNGLFAPHPGSGDFGSVDPRNLALEVRVNRLLKWRLLSSTGGF